MRQEEPQFDPVSQWIRLPPPNQSNQCNQCLQTVSLLVFCLYVCCHVKRTGPGPVLWRPVEVMLEEVDQRRRLSLTPRTLGFASCLTCFSLCLTRLPRHSACPAALQTSWQ